MPRQYPTGFRDEMVGRMLAGESVSDLVLEFGMPMQTLHLLTCYPFSDPVFL